MSTANTNNRASLLSGLRTGGVRSTSLNVPHTAAPTGAFNVPRMASYNNPNIYYEEEEDQFLDQPQQQPMYNRAMPVTAAVDGPNNRFSQHQTRMMNPNSVPFSPGPAYAPNMMQQQQFAPPQNAMQMQMLQIEMFKLQQALQVQQAQQLQAEMIAQAQRQQQLQAQAQARRSSIGYNPPATAGPMNQSFDIRSATLSAQQRRANQADQLRTQLGLGVQPDDQVPMTAALGGRFGSRTASLSVPGAQIEENTVGSQAMPQTPGGTTVISGGTSLGAVQSKSDAASSWRRGGNNNSVLSGNRSTTSPAVKVTPPPIETKRVSPPPGLSTGNSNNSGPKFRPQPLRFSAAVSQPIPAVTIDTTDDDTDADTHSSESSVKSSSPTTPRSSSSNEMPLSPREEASKKLYEGLGIGRPVSSTSSAEGRSQQCQTASVSHHRMVSQPTRQPRGPPSGTEELGPKNFASRIRRKAIGGLGALMDARERREIVEAF